MAEPASCLAPDQPDWRAEVTRLNKIIRVLMDRAERSTSAQSSDFGLFQTTIILEAQVRRRTAELEAALRENEKINHALGESEAKFRGLVSQSLVGIVLIEDGKFSYSNARFDEMFGYSADEVRNLRPTDVAIESDRAFAAENLRKRVSGEVDHVDVGGKLILISLVLDITERTRAEREVQALQARLRDQSTHDALTGLYNRRYLEQTLGRELVLAERAGHPVSVIMGDLDRFKAVNDRLGHLAGDEVLRVFGDLLKRQARGSDIYCRYGGEEFLLVLPGMAEASAIERAELLRSAIAAAPVAYGVSEIAVTASFGIATFPRHGRTGDELIAAADSALYAAKTAGRNRVNLAGLGDRSVHVGPVIGSASGAAR
jgi:diguanylate cyclase (GGDEF)-like protein